MALDDIVGIPDAFDAGNLWRRCQHIRGGA
jgi:hypothetical protein